MIIDGKKIAAEIYAEVSEEIRSSGKHPCLTVFACASNVETKRYMELKKKRAAELGVDVLIMELDPDTDTEGAVRAIRAADKAADGVIVQLPFPAHIDVPGLLAAIPKELDVDAINYSGEETEILPPVVGAIAEISMRHNIVWKEKKVAVVGQGRLVGKPAALWAKAEGATVSIVDKDTKDSESILLEADIIITGAGVPGLITPDKIKDGVIIFDAGTSEEGGELRGDCDPLCASKCALFTPVPGGIGPITIAVLLRNLLSLSKK